jgi:hypothetical protein
MAFVYIAFVMFRTTRYNVRSLRAFYSTFDVRIQPINKLGIQIDDSTHRKAKGKASKQQGSILKSPSLQLVFGQTFTDHMLSIEYEQGQGWKAPHIHEFRPISLLPSATVFHYGIEVI